MFYNIFMIIVLYYSWESPFNVPAECRVAGVCVGWFDKCALSRVSVVGCCDGTDTPPIGDSKGAAVACTAQITAP